MLYGLGVVGQAIKSTQKGSPVISRAVPIVHFMTRSKVGSVAKFYFASIGHGVEAPTVSSGPEYYID